MSSVLSTALLTRPGSVGIWVQPWFEALPSNSWTEQMFTLAFWAFSFSCPLGRCSEQSFCARSSPWDQGYPQDANPGHAQNTSPSTLASVSDCPACLCPRFWAAPCPEQTGPPAAAGPFCREPRTVA